MKTNFTGCALALALAASATLTSSAHGANSADLVSLALPGEETPLAEGVALFAPSSPALSLQVPATQLPCPTVYPSIAGDLSKLDVVRPAREPEPEISSRHLAEAFTLVDGTSTPEPTTVFLAALAGVFVATARRRTIS